MKMLKKMTCLALALTMLLTACAFAEEDSSLYFELKLVKALDQSTQEWTATSFDRAMFTSLIYLDCFLAAEDGDVFTLESLVSQSSYVGVDDNMLIAYCHANGKDVVIICDPTASLGCCSFYDPLPDSVVEQVMDSICTGGYSKNSTSDIRSALEVVQSALLSD